MSLYELNKIAGAVLFALLVLFGTRTVSNIIFAPHAPETPGYEIEVASEDADSGPATQKPAEVPLANLLQQANVERGQRSAKKCAACHTFDQGGASRVGPNLYNIVGQPLGAEQGFSYSQALKDKGGDWNYEDLDQFIKTPRAYLPGTKMAFAGISRPGERADLILYLRSLSPNPVALPEPVPEPEAEPATADTGEPSDGTGHAAGSGGADQKPAADGGTDQESAADAGQPVPGAALAAENATPGTDNQPAQSEPGKSQ